MVNSCGFSPDGKRLISASDDGTIRIWNINDGSTNYIYSSSGDQWYGAEFIDNRLEKIIGTELSWKMANLAKENKDQSLDELECFSYWPEFLGYRHKEGRGAFRYFLPQDMSRLCSQFTILR